MNKKHLFYLVSAGAVLLTSAVPAAVFELADDQDALIGELRITRAVYEDTLPNIARANDLGYTEIKLSNPGVDTWIPGEGREVVLPSLFLLPHAPRNGIILNVPEMRLYYFPPRKRSEPIKVITYPVGIGREGWHTPYVRTNVAQKQKDPTWYPPESIREEHAAKGDPLPKMVRPGPDNPLGKFAMRLGLAAYLIHGTNKPSGVGMRVSHGCIRLYPENIEELFSLVPVGTPVNIINQPYKLARHQGKIYLEAHPYLEEDAPLFRDNLTSVVRMLIDITKESGYDIDWALANSVIREMKGIPVVIGSFTGSMHPVAENSGADNSNLKLRLDTELSTASP